MKFKSFILHLPRSTQRQRNVLTLQNMLPWPVEIFECVDGQSLTTIEIGKFYQRNIFHPNYPFELNSREIGIFLTFRKLWRHILDEGIEVAMIAEDDVAVDRKCFESAFEVAIRYAEEREHIKFNLRPLKSCVSKVKCGEYTLAVEKTVPLGMVCHLISYRSAEKLLYSSRVFDRPVDCHLQLVNFTGETISTIWPSGVREISNTLGGSSIHQNRIRFDPFLQMRRQVDRSLYRFQVGRLHRQFFPLDKSHLTED